MIYASVIYLSAIVTAILPGDLSFLSKYLQLHT